MYSFKLLAPLPIMIGVAALAITSFVPIAHYATQEDVSFTVVKSERVTTGVGTNASSKYLVYTDEEVFENTDSFLSMKFNSSDIYGSLGEDDNCDATVTGFRVPFLSIYRNILAVECVGGSA